MASSRSSYDDRLPKSRTDRTYFPYINKKSSAFLLEALPEILIKKKRIAIFLEYDSINSLTFPNETDERGAVTASPSDHLLGFTKLPMVAFDTIPISDSYTLTSP